MKKCLKKMHHNGCHVGVKLVLYAIEALSLANVDCLLRCYLSFTCAQKLKIEKQILNVAELVICGTVWMLESHA
jgi:hypothetical protein